MKYLIGAFLTVAAILALSMLISEVAWGVIHYGFPTHFE